MIDLTPILQAIIAVVAVLITRYLIPYLKNKLTTDQQAKLTAAIETAVNAAEQIFTDSGQGAAKKAYVVELLKEKGFTVDTEDLDKAIDAAIEAAVYQLNKG